MQTKLIEHAGWTLRIRQPALPGPYPVALLLHGWKGNEDVMWIFAGRLPANSLIIAPRAPYPASSGYSWVEERTDSFSSYDMFLNSIRQLRDLTKSLDQLYYGDFSKVHLMGFSQGAAACFAWVATHPEQVVSLAALASFVPEGIDAVLKSNSLAGLPVFIAHGTNDQTVPISIMRTGSVVLQNSGAELVYCEDPVEHRLGSGCMRSLGDFYREIFMNRG